MWFRCLLVCFGAVECLIFGVFGVAFALFVAIFGYVSDGTNFFGGVLRFEFYFFNFSLSR